MHRNRRIFPNAKSWWEIEVKAWIKRASKEYGKAKAADATREEKYLMECVDAAKAEVSMGKEERCLYFQHKANPEMMQKRRLDRLKLKGKISKIESETGGLSNLIRARRNRTDKLSELLVDGQPTSDSSKIMKEIKSHYGKLYQLDSHQPGSRKDILDSVKREIQPVENIVIVPMNNIRWHILCLVTHLLYTTVPNYSLTTLYPTTLHPVTRNVYLDQRSTFEAVIKSTLSSSLHSLN